MTYSSLLVHTMYIYLHDRIANIQMSFVQVASGDCDVIRVEAICRRASAQNSFLYFILFYIIYLFFYLFTWTSSHSHCYIFIHINIGNTTWSSIGAVCEVSFTVLYDLFTNFFFFFFSLTFFLFIYVHTYVCVCLYIGLNRYIMPHLLYQELC